MNRIRKILWQHRYFFIVVTLLTLVTTFPTIVYVFRTDVFWLPTGPAKDVFIELWDIWYTKLILAGQADRFYTNLIYYPDGVSLAYDPKFLLYNIAVNLLQLAMPISNAYCLAFLLLIGASALAAYSYALWLFKDKWIALLGAAIFALSPQILGNPHWPKIAWIWPIPIILYLVHRGIVERRASLLALAGLLSGILGEIIHYNFTCLIISLMGLALTLAISRWRQRRFWGYVLLLVAVSALSCAWRVLPLLNQPEELGVALDYYQGEYWNDLTSFFVNPTHPILGPLAKALLHPPPDAAISSSSYLGVVPIALLLAGLANSATRRKMLPWLGLLLVFVVLHLGSTLNINGMVFESIKLPKYYLDQLLPELFRAFTRANHFMAGVCLPLAILACYGFSALRSRFRVAAGSGCALLLVGVVAFEYHIPVAPEFEHKDLGRLVVQEEPTFVDWLETEAIENIRLIHIPFGRVNSKYYYFYQVLSGYPQTEGAISRVPDSAYNYIRSNDLLNAWHQQQPASCQLIDRNKYLAALAQLESDGFSHVVYHPERLNAEAIKGSFREAEPSFEDANVWIFRLNDLRDSCAEAPGAHLAFTRAYDYALQQRSILAERNEYLLVFPPTIRATDHFLRYLRHFADIDRTLATVASDERANIKTQHLDVTKEISSAGLEQHAALWLVNSPETFAAEQTPAFQDWFARRFHFCRRVGADEGAAFDLYLRAGVPCSAMDDSSAMEIQYDFGVRLHNASYDFTAGMIRFYLAWANTSRDKYSFSLQFFDVNGQKALQEDRVIRHQLLSTYEIDASSLPAGVYSIQLIVYDFETLASQGGTVTDTGERFDRALEIGSINWSP